MYHLILETIPLPAGLSLAAFPNPAYLICKAVNFALINIGFIILVAAQIVYEVLDRTFEVSLLFRLSHILILCHFIYSLMNLL